MNILYIITKSEAGGAQTHVFQMADYMKQRGHTVAVMAGPGGWLEKELVRIGVMFIPNPFFTNNYNIINGLCAISRIRQTVRDFKPDIVSCHSSSAGFWGRLAICNSVVTVFTAHGWGFTEGVAPIRKYIVKTAERIVNRFCKKIICVSDRDRTLAESFGIDPDKCVTIHNGVEDWGSRLVDRECQTDGVRIVSIGRLSHPKRPEMIIAAVALLPRKLQEMVHVHIIGGGEKMTMVRNEIARHQIDQLVTLHGSLSREEAMRILSDNFSAGCSGTTIFVLMSDYEGLPRSILEAMSLGISVIASDVGGVAEVVNESTGIVIPRNSRPADLAAALEELIRSPETRIRLGRAARARIDEYFTIRHMQEKTLAIYENLIAH